MLKKVAANDLRLGMHIHELCGRWIDHPFWRTKFVVTDAEDIRNIVGSGISEVWIDIDKGLDVAANAAAKPKSAGDGAPAREARRAPLALTEEVQRAAKICAKSKDAVVFMFQDVRMGQAIKAEAAATLVDDISESVARNPVALISIARLKTVDDYSYMHSVAVSALMVTLARQLGHDEALVREAGMAGLLHDLGKAQIPLAVLNKPGALTDAEFATVKRHPEEGYRLLKESGGIGQIALDVCLHHHEKLGGHGYPAGIGGDGIGLHARMCAVCDVYDAITSDRPYKSGWNPAEAIHKMTAWTGGHLDRHVFEAFVKCIGIYPVGSLVRMASGRLGVVIGQSAKSLLGPVVKIFFSTKSNAHVAPEIIDLSRPGTTDRIVAPEDADTLGLGNIDELWMAA